MNEHKWKRGHPLCLIGVREPPLQASLPRALTNGYKRQRTSNLIAKGNDAVSIRLDPPQKAISSNNKKKKITELGVKPAGIDSRVSVLNATAEGHKVVLTELLTADKRGGEKTKLVSAENKLQINHPP